MSKKTMVYIGIFLVGVWAGPKVAPTLRRVPVVGGLF
jgi:hypothetical protein